MKKYLTSFIAFICFINCYAGSVDTISIFSTAMQKNIKCVVIKPSNYKKKKDFPVVYLLHGYSGNYSNWITKVPLLKKYVDEYNLLIVCPDGDYSSWYFNSPIDSTFKYETHIATEVVAYIDKHYKTNPIAEKRAITGLSMGGHGALFLALKHPTIFGAAGSMSGGVDLKESKNKFDISKRIGDTINYANNWYNLTVLNLIENYRNTQQKIIFDCGFNDFFIEGNRKLHQKMLTLKIPHTYIEREGEHNWTYWQNAIEYQLIYFKNVFKTNY